MNRQFFYRSPDTDGGGAGTPEPSLADLGGGSDGFTPQPTEEELTAAAAKQVGIGGLPKDQNIADVNNDDPADPNKKPDDPGDASTKIPGKEGDDEPKRNADGHLVNDDDQLINDKGELVDEDGNVITPTDQGTNEDYYAAVDLLRGDDISKEIKYPEGVDPISPEGTFFREQFLEARAEQRFEAYLKEADPRGYAYLLHRQNGGNDKEFFETPSLVLPSLEDLKVNVDLQREIYEADLLAKGNTPKATKALIEMAIKDGELLSLSEEAYKNRETAEANELKRLNEDIAKADEKKKADIATFDSTLTKAVIEGSDLKFIVPEADKPKFLAALKENVLYEDGKFYLVKPLEADKLPEILQAELFNYLKGDLSKLVERKAKSITSQKLTLKTKDTRVDPKRVAGQNRSQTLGDL